MEAGKNNKTFPSSKQRRCSIQQHGVMFHFFQFPSESFTVIINKQKYCKNNSQDVAEERAAKVFQQLDVNDDGELNEEEFVFGALKV